MIKRKFGIIAAAAFFIITAGIMVSCAKEPAEEARPKPNGNAVETETPSNKGAAMNDKITETNTNEGEALMSYTITEGSLSDFIVVDQFGYRPEAEKVAVIRNPKRGPDSDVSFAPGDVYLLINKTENTIAFQGAPAHMFADDPASGDEIWWFDFSSVQAPGRYYVLDVENDACSPSFTIGGDVYNEVLKHALRMFYYQRAGFPKEAKYAGEGWVDEASHIKPGQDAEARDFHNRVADTERDLSGGWYDAGDFNKYTPWTARYIEEMLNIYRERPGVFTDNYNIPESGNGIPDIIDEAKWGMDYLLKLQNADGSMLSVVGLAGGVSPPSATTKSSYYGRVNTTSALAAVRAFALGSIVLAEWYPDYAASLKTAAEKAWAWAEANPDVLYQNNNSAYESSGLAAGGQEIMDDSTGGRRENRLFAALYMYEMTGDKSFQKIFEDQYQRLPLTTWGNFMDHYRTSQHLLYFYYMNLPDPDATAVNNIKTRMVSAFNKSSDFMGKVGKDGYRSFMTDYNWGSNQAKSSYGFTFYYWAEYEMEPSKSPDIFLNAAQGYLHYIHGVNPFGRVYLTNMNNYGATKSLSSIFHDWFSENSPEWSRTEASSYGPASAYGPAPGYLSGGANQYYRRRDNNTFVEPLDESTPAAKMYIDFNKVWPESSWEITEPSNGYQIAYIRLLSKFVEPSI